jgi:shikimate dehydrogenase
MTTGVPRAAVIGSPIAQSKSPLIHRFWLDQLGLDGQYDACSVEPGDLAAFVQTLRSGDWRGCNVTIPHKLAVMALCDKLTPLAEAVGAVNTVYRVGADLVGHNTDIGGFTSALPTLAGPTVCVLGAGGAARAIVAGLAAMGCAPIRVVSRDPAKAATLPGPVAAFDWAHVADALSGAVLLVNTTSLGMTGQPPLTLDLSPLAADAVVNDIVYAPLETQLLAQARAQGLRTVDGLSMLIGQAAEAFALFFGEAPNRADDDRLRERLIACSSSA